MRVIFKPEIHSYNTCHMHKVRLIIAKNHRFLKQNPPKTTFTPL